MFGSERLTGALLDRLTHHVHILEMNGESHRLAQSKRRARHARPDTSFDETTANLDQKSRFAARSKLPRHSRREIAPAGHLNADCELATPVGGV
jgi:hypothetical protein